MSPTRNMVALQAEEVAEEVPKANVVQQEQPAQRSAAVCSSCRRLLQVAFECAASSSRQPFMLEVARFVWSWW